MSSRPRTRAVTVLAAVLGTALTGCSDIYFDRRESIAAHAGDAVATNQVTHMVDPWPRASGTATSPSTASACRRRSRGTGRTPSSGR